MLQGLSAAQAAHRLARDRPNALPGSKPKSIARIMVKVLSEPMFLMLLTAACIYLALGDRAEALFLLAFVFAVIGTTLAQQRKTRRASRLRCMCPLLRWCWCRPCWLGRCCCRYTLSCLSF